MGYIVEIDDLSKRIEYPPRGVEFAPLPTDMEEAETQPPPKPLWQQAELALAFAETKPEPNGGE